MLFGKSSLFSARAGIPTLALVSPFFLCLFGRMTFLSETQVFLHLRLESERSRSRWCIKYLPSDVDERSITQTNNSFYHASGCRNEHTGLKIINPIEAEQHKAKVLHTVAYNRGNIVSQPKLFRELLTQCFKQIYII